MTTPTSPTDCDTTPAEARLLPERAPPAVYPIVPRTLVDLERIAGICAASGLFKGLAGREPAAAAAVIIMRGLSMGLEPVTALMGMHVIEGKPELSAALIGARIKASLRYDYRCTVRTAERCTVVVRERDGARWVELAPITYEIGDARRAGLADKANWKKDPASMLFARAIARAARTHCPDVLMGPVYAEGEIAEAVEVRAIETTGRVVEPEEHGVPGALLSRALDVIARCPEAWRADAKRKLEACSAPADVDALIGRLRTALARQQAPAVPAEPSAADDAQRDLEDGADELSFPGDEGEPVGDPA